MEVPHDYKATEIRVAFKISLKTLWLDIIKDISMFSCPKRLVLQTHNFFKHIKKTTAKLRDWRYLRNKGKINSIWIQNELKNLIVRCHKRYFNRLLSNK